MKKIMLALCFIIASIGVTNAQTETQQERPGAGRMREMMKQRLKDDLKFTDVQVDSVLSIQQDFQGKNRQLRNDQGLSEDDRNIKMKSLNDERKLKLKTILSDEQISKLDAFYDEMRKQRQQRQGNN